jgi:hypothetical protein
MGNKKYYLSIYWRIAGISVASFMIYIDVYAIFIKKVCDIDIIRIFLFIMAIIVAIIVLGLNIEIKGDGFRSNIFNLFNGKYINVKEIYKIGSYSFMSSYLMLNNGKRAMIGLSKKKLAEFAKEVLEVNQNCFVDKTIKKELKKKYGIEAQNNIAE